jgi:uroporphyrinogen-III synthase
MGDKLRRVIVTRPSQDAAYWVGELENSGFKAQALPLIEIGPVTDPTDTALVQKAWRHLNDYAACMFVSGNAVQYFFREKIAVGQLIQFQNAINDGANKELSSLPVSLRFLAPGPGTAAALLAEGVPAAQIDSPPIEAGQFDSEALWQVVGRRDWRGKRVLVLRGQTSGTAPYTVAGRDWLAQQFRAAGAQVDRLSVYQRSAPRFTDVQLQLVQNARQDGSVWLFSSSEALANLMQQPLLGGAGGASGADWRGARAIATHPRIAQAVRDAGWGVVQETRPMLADILDAMRSIESDTYE